MKKIIIFLTLCLSVFSLSFTALAAESYSNADIIKEIVYAYDRQGDTILYDQLNSRRHVSASPEDATSQKTIYLDCSSFVNSCYVEAFGINILPYDLSEKSCSTLNYHYYARGDFGENPGVIGHWEAEDWANAEDKQAIVDFMKENLQIGDVLNYRHLKSSGSYAGHVYIYVGNSTFYHCAGAGSYTVNTSNPSKSYENDETETNRIQYISFANIFTTTTSSRYIFKATTEDTVTCFSLHRPLSRDNVTPTEKTLKRMAIAGLDSEKTSDVAPNTAVFAGDTITYTVAMKNYGSNALEGVSLTDTLPEGTEFVSGSEGVTVTDGVLSWIGDIASGATVNVSYTVSVTKNPASSLIVSDKTDVGGVKLATITHTVSGLTKAQISLVVDTAKNHLANGSEFRNGIDMTFDIYRSVLGVDLYEYVPLKQTEQKTIYTDENGKLVGLTEGVSYEYANLNDTALLKELAENGALSTGFTYSPVTEDTVLTAGIWGVREVSGEDVHTVYVKGDSTYNILHLDEDGKVVDDGRTAKNFKNAVTLRDVRDFSKGVWCGPLGYHGTTGNNLTLASGGYDSLINHAGKAYAGLFTGDDAVYNLDYAGLVHAVESEYATYQYLDNEVIPFAEFVSYSYQTRRYRSYITASGTVNTKFIFYVITENGELVTREWTDAMTFNTDSKKTHTVKVTDFEDTTGYIVAMEIHPTGDVPETTTLSATSNASSDNGSIFNIILIKDGYKTFADTAVLDTVIDTEKLTISADSDFAKITAPSLYGGMTIRTGMYKIPDSVRSRLVKESDLAVGDIIVADWSGGIITYLYIGDSTLLSVESGKIVTKTIGDDIYGTDADNILVSLYAYDRFAVIRPSMSALEANVTVESIEVTQMPDKAEYFTHETFEKAGMVVTATLSNGNTVDVSDYTVSHDAFAYPSTTVTVSYGDLSTSIDVTVHKIEDIKIATLPTKMSYFNKEAFDPEGMVVNAVFSSGDELAITDYVVSPEVFVYPDNVVTVTFGDYTKTFEVELSSEYRTVSVSEAHTLDSDAMVCVEGYFVGAGDDGQKEILIKDINSDTVIAVRGVPGTYPDYEYKYGDKVKITVCVAITSSTYDYDRKYLKYSEENSDIAATIESRGNKITFNFDNVIEVKSQSDFASVLSTNDNFYKYIKVSGTTYFSGYKSSSATNPERFRIHMNPNAAEVSNIRTNGSQVANLTLSTHYVNLGESWYTDLFGIDYQHGAFPGPSSDKSFYAIYAGANQYYNRLVILDESWVLDPIKATDVSLLLDGKIGVKVYFEYDNAVLDSEALTYTATLKNTEIGNEEILDIPVTLDDNGRTAYAVIYINPKDADNTVVNSVISAGSHSVEVPELSVQTYIDAFKDHEEYDEYSSLISALENYLSAADIYFDASKTFDEETELSEDEESILENVKSFASVTSKTVGNLEHASTSLILEGAVTIRHYFKATGEAALDDYTVEGGTALKYADSDGYVYTDIANIPAHELGSLNTVKVSFGEESTELTFSAYNYIALTYDGIEDAKLRNLVKLLFKYGYEAAFIENGEAYATELRIIQMPEKTVYTHHDTVDTLDLTGGKLEVIYSDYSTKTIDMTADLLSEESEEWKIGTVNYVLEYAGESVKLPIVYENTAMSVTELKKCEVGSTYEFTGIVVGAISTHKYAELLIKDKNSDEYIGIINTGVVGSIYAPSLDTSVVNIGDEIIVSATYYRESTTSSIKGSRGRYGANATNNDTFVSGLMIVSHNNEVEFDLTSATEISTQTELEAFLDDTSNFYKLVKFKGMKAIQYKNSSSKLGYRIFFGTGVTAQSQQNINGISPFIFHPTVDLYLPNGIKSYFSNSSSTSYSSPATTEYDVYAMFVGGNSYYYDFVIFGEEFMVK